MSASVIICSGEPERRGGRHEDHLSASPCAAAAHSKHAGGNSPIFGTDVFSSVRGRLGIGAANPGQPVPFNFSRPFKAPGSLTSHTRIQFLAEQFRGEAPINHVVSFPNAPELHEQHRRRRLECPTKALKDLTK